MTTHLIILTVMSCYNSDNIINDTINAREMKN